MNPEILIFEFSLKKPIEKFGYWLVQQMDHSGIPLYLILHPEEIEILVGTEAIGLEVNLPTGIDVYVGRDDSDRGRKKPKVDLLFKKENTYYLVQVIDRESITKKDKEITEQYAQRFKESLGASVKAQVIPIIVKPKEKGPSSAFAELYGLFPPISHEEK
jgi:hypothetical protein